VRQGSSALASGGRQLRGAKASRDSAGNHLAIDTLQLAVVAGLIGQQEGLLGADGLDEIAPQQPGSHILAQYAQLLLVGRAPACDFAFVAIDDRQLGDTSGNARFGMAGLQRQRLREIGGGFVVAAEVQ